MRISCLRKAIAQDDAHMVSDKLIKALKKETSGLFIIIIPSSSMGEGKDESESLV